MVYGDTLYNIAKKYNTTVSKLMELNNLKTSVLSIGQILKIQDNVTSNLPTTIGEYYEVLKGDTLYSIANKYNLSVDELKELNNLNSNTLSIGQKLKVITNPPKEDNYDNIYTVKNGDTLYSIAKANNTNVNTLMELNNLSSTMINLNQKLILPSKNYYTVKKGDTLYAIANKYNTTVDNIKKLNNLTTNILTIGTKLIVP